VDDVADAAGVDAGSLHYAEANAAARLSSSTLLLVARARLHAQARRRQPGAARPPLGSVMC
jgi:hypothetical protein